MTGPIFLKSGLIPEGFEDINSNVSSDKEVIFYPEGEE